jgi:hypothetical protein
LCLSCCPVSGVLRAQSLLYRRSPTAEVCGKIPHDTRRYPSILVYDQPLISSPIDDITMNFDVLLRLATARRPLDNTRSTVYPHLSLYTPSLCLENVYSTINNGDITNFWGSRRYVSTAVLGSKRQCSTPDVMHLGPQLNPLPTISLARLAYHRHDWNAGPD